MSSFRISVPATSANLGPGFDVLGLALSIYNTAEVIQLEGEAAHDGTPPQTAAHDGTPLQAAEHGGTQSHGETGAPVIESLQGEGAAFLPEDESNLFIQSMNLYAGHAGAPLPSCRLRLSNQIPLARGMGSSAATIVGGLAAAASLMGHPIDRSEILRIAAAHEGHADNVAAAVYGGLAIAYEQSDEPDAAPSFAAHKVAPAAGIAALLIIPTDELSTAKARSALDATVSRRDAVYNIGRSSLMVSALLTGDLQLLTEAVKDRLHQSQRLPLLPYFDKIRQLLSGCDINAMALSGAGPTMIAFVAAAEAGELYSKTTALMAEQELPVQVKWCHFAERGLVVETLA